MKKLILTNEWVKIKEIFEANTNGNEEYGKNFKVGGELDILTRSFLDRLGDITTLKGFECVIDDIKMDLWKERIWSVIENAGLLPPIAWKLDIAKQEEIDRKLEEEEKKWAGNDEFDELDDYEPTDEELSQTEDPELEPNPTNIIAGVDFTDDLRRVDELVEKYGKSNDSDDYRWRSINVEKNKI